MSEALRKERGAGADLDPIRGGSVKDGDLCGPQKSRCLNIDLACSRALAASSQMPHSTPTSLSVNNHLIAFPYSLANLNRIVAPGLI